MKRICLILCTSCALFGSVQGQILGGIFSQKSSDLKSVAKQMALLQLYIGRIEQGYKVAQVGLTTIGNLKNGEFSLHAGFFNSLSAVNPEIKKYSKVEIIISDQLFVAQHIGKILEIKHLTAGEKKYAQIIYSNMIEACTNSLSELNDILSDNTYQMHDNERINYIDWIYTDMEEKVALTKRFTDEVLILSGQRAAEENDIEFLQNPE